MLRAAAARVLSNQTSFLSLRPTETFCTFLLDVREKNVYVKTKSVGLSTMREKRKKNKRRELHKTRKDKIFLSLSLSSLSWVVLFFQWLNNLKKKKSSNFEDEKSGTIFSLISSLIRRPIGWLIDDRNRHPRWKERPLNGEWCLCPCIVANARRCFGSDLRVHGRPERSAKGKERRSIFAWTTPTTYLIENSWLRIIIVIVRFVSRSHAGFERCVFKMSVAIRDFGSVESIAIVIRTTSYTNQRWSIVLILRTRIYRSCVQFALDHRVGTCRLWRFYSFPDCSREFEDSSCRCDGCACLRRRRDDPKSSTSIVQRTERGFQSLLVTSCQATPRCPVACGLVRRQIVRFVRSNFPHSRSTSSCQQVVMENLCAERLSSNQTDWTAVSELVRASPPKGKDRSSSRLLVRSIRRKVWPECTKSSSESLSSRWRCKDRPERNPVVRRREPSPWLVRCFWCLDRSANEREREKNKFSNRIRRKRKFSYAKMKFHPDEFVLLIDHFEGMRTVAMHKTETIRDATIRIENEELDDRAIE